MRLARRKGNRAILALPLSLVSALGALCLGATACGRDASAHPNQATLQPRVEEVSDSSLIVVAHPEQFPLVTVATRSVTDRLGGTCVVSPDINRTVPVNALGGGRVVQLRASLGDVVRKGQPLVSISSPDLSGALADYHKAVADEILARRQFDRSRLLLEHGSIAQKDLESAQDTEDKARVDVRATEDRIRLLGGDPTSTSPLIELTSPISGTIIEQNVTPAAGVKSPDNEPNLFTIADLSHLWVLCDVYENDLHRVHLGALARIRINGDSGRAFVGRIGNISQVLDPNTRTARVRIELDNADGVLRPGMFGVVALESRASRTSMALPTTAIVQLHDADCVFVKVGRSSFRRVTVNGSGEIQPGVVEILSGISPGEQVVRSALEFAQAIDR